MYYDKETVIMIVVDEKLNKMGKSWFVSYCYNQCIDLHHMNWSRTSSVNMRIGFYNGSIGTHKQYLQAIMQSDENSLNRNSIGLTGRQVKTMAQELLNRMN